METWGTKGIRSPHREPQRTGKNPYQRRKNVLIPTEAHVGYGIMTENSDPWFDDYSESEDDVQVDEYDITSTPNDFNVLTLYSLVEARAVLIPGFQRNYVWDRSRASKLIESLIVGLPVPQLFLYEKARNLFQVIDGQQRLMSIYYFLKKRFPKKEKRVELRMIFDREGVMPDDVLHDDNYFEDFKLKLPERLPAAHVREMIEESFKRLASLDIFEKGLHGHPRSREHGRSAEAVRVGYDKRVW